MFYRRYNKRNLAYFLLGHDWYVKGMKPAVILNCPEYSQVMETIGSHEQRLDVKAQFHKAVESDIGRVIYVDEGRRILLILFEILYTVGQSNWAIF